MKTSLNINDYIYEKAQREAQNQSSTISEIISFWAQVGLDFIKKQRVRKKSVFKPVDLGGPAEIDLNSRRDWMDLLDE